MTATAVFASTGLVDLHRLIQQPPGGGVGRDPQGFEDRDGVIGITATVRMCNPNALPMAALIAAGIGSAKQT